MRDADGGVWAARSVSLAVGDEALWIELPLIEVAGRVTMGGEGIGGRLVLAERPERVAVDVREDGSFEVVLPREGTWGGSMTTGIEAGREATIQLAPFEVRRKPGQDRVSIELELPDTRIEGEVVDRLGTPVPDATIQVSRQDRRGRSSTHSDEDGYFALWGVREGTSWIVASEGDRISGTIVIVVDEDRASPRLRLEIRERSHLEGTVVSSAGPVAGAEILVWPALSGSGGGEAFRLTSGLDGTFSAEVESFHTRFSLFVRASGFAARIISLPIQPDAEPATVSLDPAGGELVIDATGAPSRLALGGRPRASVLFADGISVPLAVLQVLRLTESANLLGRQQAGRYRIPFVASGSYSLCWAGTPAPRAGEGGDSSCTSGWLAPGGSLTLTLPGQGFGQS